MVVVRKGGVEKTSRDEERKLDNDCCGVEEPRRCVSRKDSELKFADPANSSPFSREPWHNALTVPKQQLWQTPCRFNLLAR